MVDCTKEVSRQRYESPILVPSILCDYLQNGSDTICNISKPSKPTHRHPYLQLEQLATTELTPDLQKIIQHYNILSNHRGLTNTVPVKLSQTSKYPHRIRMRGSPHSQREDRNISEKFMDKSSSEAIKSHINVAVAFGGYTPCSGVHNVLAGIYDYLSSVGSNILESDELETRSEKSLCSNAVKLPGLRKTICCSPHKSFTLYGFLNGSSGLVKGEYIKLTREKLLKSMNSPGCELLGFKGFESPCFQTNQDLYENGCSVLPTETHMCRRIVTTCQNLELDALVLVGGQVEMDFAARLATYFLRAQSDFNKSRKVTRVLAVPAYQPGFVFPSIPIEQNTPPHNSSGSLKIESKTTNYVPMPLGFESAAKTLAEYCGNICQDSSGSKKYYHFVNCGSCLLTLEAACSVRPTFVLLACEYCGPTVRKVTDKDNITLPYWRLKDITNLVVDIITERRQHSDKRSGTILLSSSLIDDLYQLQILKDNINQLHSNNNLISSSDMLCDLLQTEDLKCLYRLLPEPIQSDLALSGSSYTIPHIEPQRFLAHLVDNELKRRRAEKSSPVPVFNYHVVDLTQETICPPPTPLECSLGYSLGLTCGGLISAGVTGYLACIPNLNERVLDWMLCGVPLVCLMSLSSGVPKMAGMCIDVEGLAFRGFKKLNLSWRIKCHYRVPGPVQYDEYRHELPLVVQGIYETNLNDFKKLIQLTDDDYISNRHFEGNRLYCDSKQTCNMSTLQRIRLNYEPTFHPTLLSDFQCRKLDVTCTVSSYTATPALKYVFPFTFSNPGYDILPPDREIHTYEHTNDVNGRFCLGGDHGSFHHIINPNESRKLRLGLCFNGRQTPGAMNIVCGVFDYLKKKHTNSELFGILGGLIGLIQGFYIELDDKKLSAYRNQGGLDLICRSTEYFSNQSDLEKCRRSAEALKLDGLIMCGGVPALTNTALLSEFLLAHNCQTSVIAIPLSVDGGVTFVEAPIGHDTACKVLASTIGNLMSEARSSNSWYFIRTTGRTLSHICIECAVETQPTIVLIPEEIEQERMGVLTLTGFISDIVQRRASEGLNYGVLLMPDSVLSHVPEMLMLIEEVESYFYGRTEGGCSRLLSADDNNTREGGAAKCDVEVTEKELERIRASLTPWSGALFDSLPQRIQWQLAFKKDQSNRVDLESIDTEMLLKGLVEQELSRRKAIGMFKKGAFRCKTHSLTYHGRSALPTNFDCHLGFTYGCLGAALVERRLSGYMAKVSGLDGLPSDWTLSSIPCSCLLRVTYCTEDGKNNGKSIELHKAESDRGRTHKVALNICRKPTERLSLSPEGHCNVKSTDLDRNTDQKLSCYNVTEDRTNVLFVRVEGVVSPLDLQCPIIRFIMHKRGLWATTDSFIIPNPVQFNPHYNDDLSSWRAQLLNWLKYPPFNPANNLREISRLCAQVKAQCCTSRNPALFKVASSTLSNIVETLEIIKTNESMTIRDSSFWVSVLEMSGSKESHYYDVEPLKNIEDQPNQTLINHQSYARLGSCTSEDGVSALTMKRLHSARSPYRE